MEFVDYKCLESLLIEGEDLIATEGLSYKLSYKIKTAILNFFKMIGSMIDKLINIIKSKFSKNRTDNKNTSTESDKKSSSVKKDNDKNEKVSEYIKEMHYKEEIMKNNPIKKSKKDGWLILNDAIKTIDNFLSNVNFFISGFRGPTYESEHYLVTKLEKTEEDYENVVDKYNNFHSIITDNEYEFYLESKHKEFALDRLNNLDNFVKQIIKKLEQQSNIFEDIYSDNKNRFYSMYQLDKETHDKYATTYSKYISLVSKCSGLISNIITDVQKI